MAFKPVTRNGAFLWEFARKSVKFLLKQREIGIERPVASPLEYVFWKEDFIEGYLEARTVPFGSVSSLFKRILLLTPSDVLQLWLTEIVTKDLRAETQGYTVSAWLRSWWTSEPTETSLTSIPSIKETKDRKWLVVNLLVQQTEVEITQTKQQVGSQWEGVKVWSQEIQLSLSATLQAMQSKLQVKRLGMIIWSDQRTGREEWSCLSSSEEPHLTVDLTWGLRNDMEVTCSLRGTELRYHPMILALAVSLWSQVDLEPQESVSAWETVALLRNAGKATWSRVTHQAPKRFILRASHVQILMTLTPTDSLQASIATIAFDIPDTPSARKTLTVTSATLNSHSDSGIEPILPSLSLRIFTLTHHQIFIESSDFTLTCPHHLYHKVKDSQSLVNSPPILTSAREQEKKIILKSALKTDLIETSDDLETWVQSFTVISGAYVYFFNSPKDVTAASYFYLTDSKVVWKDLVLTLVVETADCHLRFKSRGKLEEWLGILQNHIDFLSKTKLLPVKMEKSKGKMEKMVVFSTPKASILLKDTEMSLFVRLEILDFSLKFKKYVKIQWSNMVLTEELTSQALLALPEAGKVKLCRGEKRVNVKHLLVHWHLYTFRSVWSFFELRPYEAEAGGVAQREVKAATWLTLTCSTLDFYCANQTNGFLLAHMACEETLCSVGRLEDGSKRITVTIDRLKAEDLTDYPRTVLRRPGETPVLLVDTQLDLELVMKTDTNEKLQANFLSLHSQCLSLVYLNQPILRLWNYIQTKLLGLFDKE